MAFFFFPFLSLTRILVPSRLELGNKMCLLMQFCINSYSGFRIWIKVLFNCKKGLGELPVRNTYQLLGANCWSIWFCCNTSELYCLTLNEWNRFKTVVVLYIFISNASCSHKVILLQLRSAFIDISTIVMSVCALTAVLLYKQNPHFRKLT